MYTWVNANVSSSQYLHSGYGVVSFFITDAEQVIAKLSVNIVF